MFFCHKSGKKLLLGGSGEGTVQLVDQIRVLHYTRVPPASIYCFYHTSISMPKQVSNLLCRDSALADLRCIECSIKDGFTTFICGMARGVDIVAAEIILKMKKGNSNLRLICALPHPDFEKRWSKDWQQRYNAILSQADYIKTVCDAFSYGAYQRRNEWMVNHSDRVIAVYSGEAGGTRNTIDYAKKQGVSLVMIDG